MIEITFLEWAVVVGNVIYIIYVAGICYRNRRDTIKFKKRQKEVRYFNWLLCMGLEETSKYFNVHGQEKCYSWWVV